MLQNHHEAEDAVQEATFKAWRARDRHYRSVTTPATSPPTVPSTAATPAQTCLSNAPAQMIVIDLSAQKLVAYDRGCAFLTTPVTTGRAGLATSTGSFRVYVKHPAHQRQPRRRERPDRCGRAPVQLGPCRRRGGRRSAVSIRSRSARLPARLARNDRARMRRRQPRIRRPAAAVTPPAPPPAPA